MTSSNRIKKIDAINLFLIKYFNSEYSFSMTFDNFNKINFNDFDNPLFKLVVSDNKIILKDCLDPGLKLLEDLKYNGKPEIHLIKDNYCAIFQPNICVPLPFMLMIRDFVECNSKTKTYGPFIENVFENNKRNNNIINIDFSNFDDEDLHEIIKSFIKINYKKTRFKILDNFDIYHLNPKLKEFIQFSKTKFSLMGKLQPAFAAEGGFSFEYLKNHDPILSLTLQNVQIYGKLDARGIREFYRNGNVNNWWMIALWQLLKFYGINVSDIDFY